MRPRLQINPGPLRVISDNRREAWEPRHRGWRCEHEDGRGRCTSRDTRAYWNAADRRAESYCEKHACAAGAPPG